MLREPVRNRAAMAERQVVPPMVYGLFVTQVVGLTALQKFGLPVAGKVMAIQLPLMLLTLGYRYVRYRTLEIDARRFFFFLMFCTVALLSQSLSKHEFGLPALVLLLALYFAVAVRIEVDRKTFLRCMNAYQLAMMGIAAIVILQQIMQRLWGADSWPDLNRMMPPALLVPNFNYHREMGYKVGLFQPNAFFFLEPSFVSQWLALAIVVELVYFQRLLWLGLLTVAIVLVFAGTGLVVLGAVAPFLLVRLPPKMLLLALLAAVIGGAVGGSLGWFDQFIMRASEINEQGSSGYYRFVVPYQRLLASMPDWDAALTGVGAGNAVEYEGAQILDMAVNKLMSEYGLPTTIAFYVFFCYCLFESAPSKVLGWALFVCYNFCGGALAMPAYAMIYVTLGTLLRIKEDPESSDLRQPVSQPTRVRAPNAQLTPLRRNAVWCAAAPSTSSTAG
ncbi:MAG: hypothetical protein JWN48_5133 [Myxococcaceae bacterium]|nr:hypothetical protein [Myxococcaceae bacterium]